MMIYQDMNGNYSIWFGDFKYTGNHKTIDEAIDDYLNQFDDWEPGDRWFIRTTLKETFNTK